MTSDRPHEQHRFGDHQRALNALVSYRDMLVGLPPDDFAEAVLNVLKPFEREKPIRRLMRQRMPRGSAGYVPEDLDIVLRVFGPRYRSDAKGKVRLIETKWNPTADRPVALKGGQDRTFRLVDEMLRASQLADRYEGFYVVTHTHFELADGRIWIGRLTSPNEPVEVTPDQFVLWLSGEVPATQKPKVA